MAKKIYYDPETVVPHPIEVRYKSNQMYFRIEDENAINVYELPPCDYSDDFDHMIDLNVFFHKLTIQLDNNNTLVNSAPQTWNQSQTFLDDFSVGSELPESFITLIHNKIALQTL
jgi:hypothetical protein